VALDPAVKQAIIKEYATHEGDTRCSFIIKMIEEGCVMHNGKLAKPSIKLKEGDYILITAGQPDLGKENTPPTDFVNVRRV